MHYRSITAAFFSFNLLACSTPIDIENQPAIANHSLSRCPVNNPNALSEAFVLHLKTNNISEIKKLFQTGFSVEFQYEYGLTPLHLAAYTGNLQVLEHLITLGGDIQNPDCTQNTPLHYASINYQSEVLAYLLEKQADANAINDNGDTPLHMISAIPPRLFYKANQQDNLSAWRRYFPSIFVKLHPAEKRSLETLKNEQQKSIGHLVKAGAQLNSLNKKDYTPLFHAAMGKDVDTFRNLQKLGADLTKDSAQEAIYELAKGPLPLDVLLQPEELAQYQKNRKDHESRVALFQEPDTEYSALTELIKQLIQEYIPSSNRGLHLLPALDIAVKLGQLPIAQALLAEGAKVNPQLSDLPPIGVNQTLSPLKESMREFSTARPPLHWACQNNDLTMAAFLIQQGAKINVVTAPFDIDFSSEEDKQEQQTALSLAAQFGSKDLIELLLQKGAEVEVNKVSALIPAIHRKQAILQNILLSKSKINFLNYAEETPLSAAIQSQQPILVAELLKLGASAKQGHPLPLAMEQNNLDLVKTLVQAGADINTQKSPHSVLYTALKNGNSEAVKWLKQQGAKLRYDEQVVSPAFLASPSQTKTPEDLSLYDSSPYTAQDEHGATLLHHWLNSNHPMLRVALEQTPNINHFDKNGDTPLHIAARKGDVRSLEALLAKGAVTETYNTVGQTPLFVAISSGNLIISQALLAASPQSLQSTIVYEAFLIAVRKNNIPLVQFLISKGIEPARYGKAGESAIHNAAHLSDPSMLQLLLQHNPQLLDQPTENQKLRPIHFALQENVNDTFSYLLHEGAQTEGNAQQQSLLSLAIGSGKLEQTLALIQAGANLSEQDYLGQTPLHHGLLLNTNTQSLLTLFQTLNPSQAILSLTNHKKEGLLIYALRAKKPEIFHWLLTKSPQTTQEEQYELVQTDANLKSGWDLYTQETGNIF